ncbi:MAG: hypothetical protein WCJ58_02620 [bacterium]
MITTKSPAKLILIGEHAVVWGEPALVMPIQLFTTIKLKESADNLIHFKQDNLNFDYQISLGELLKHKVDPTNQKMQDLPIAILQTFNRFKPLPENTGLSFEIKTDIKFKGLGASTAFTVAMLKALFQEYRIADSKLMLKMAIEAESIFHGYAISGVDQSVIIANKILSYQKVANIPQFQEFPYSLSFLGEILVLDTGKAATSTGESVNYVKNLLATEPEVYQPIVKKIGELTGNLESGIRNQDKTAFYQTINEVELQLEALQVVRPKTIKLFNQLQKLGGYVKMSGAGAVKGEGSGTAICFAPDFTKIVEFLKQEKIPFFRIKLQ